MKSYVHKLLIICAVALVAQGCVSLRKYDSARAEILMLQSQLGKRNAALDSMRTRTDVAEARAEQLSDQRDNLQSEVDALTADTLRLGREGRSMQARYKKLLAEGSAESSRMLEELSRNQSELTERTRRIEELQAALDARDNALSEIRRKVSDALLGFSGKGLTITRRDGKVYVSMEDKLLFKSGSFDIDPRGAEAVRELGKVLGENPDIDVMVEGHTDNVPYHGTGQLKDNLDLSVKRATTVTRLLLENKDIQPVRIVSAGRGSSLPLSTANTSAARAKNRRTEIILTPKLDQLVELTK